MERNQKELRKQKHQFKSYYCGGCKQVKPCHTISQEYCCSCAYQTEQERNQEYSSYQQVYQRKVKEHKEHIQQLKLLQEYLGCKNCQSKEVDAYSLYENSKLVCQPCQMKKEGGASGSVNLLERQKWFKKYWKIDLGEWLEKYGCLPVNADCAKEWVKDKEHLKSCNCLEVEAKENYLLFSNSLKENKEKLKECQCENSPKIRVSSDNFAWCEKCEVSISVASKKRVIKNRNDPRFWGLEVKEKVLCGDCLERKKEKMTPLRRAKFNEYRKLGRL